MIDFSVIIPQKNSVETLPRLFATIPETSKIEVIVVDNSEVPITKEQIGIEREYTLCWSSPKRFAGGARNVGVENAHGKWLVFADADDYFTANAFDDFYKFLDSDADVVYFGMDGIYIETGERSSRGDMFTSLVRKYLSGEIDEYTLRTNFPSPCSKMVRRDLVVKHNLRYDEVRANNDDYFALLAGYYAKMVLAYDSLVYVYVATAGSIMHRRDAETMLVRLEVILRCNKFKREHGLENYQGSIAYLFSQAAHYDIKTFIRFVSLLFKYRQNPFIGWNNWINTFKKVNKTKIRDSKYYTK
jgi:glycosyltransferase involved in cell wall biosynthesis